MKKKEIKRSMFKTRDEVVIAAMHTRIWKKCMYGGKFSPIELSMDLNYECESLTEALRQIYPDAKHTRNIQLFNGLLCSHCMMMNQFLKNVLSSLRILSNYLSRVLTKNNKAI